MDWKSVVSTDKKTFNLSGPDVLNYYWHNLRRARDEVELDWNTRDGIMVWGAVCNKGAIGLECTVCFIMHSTTPISLKKIFCPSLMMCWVIFGLYNMTIHLSILLFILLSGSRLIIYISTLVCPLSRSKYHWKRLGKVVRGVDKNRKRHKNRNDLSDAIFDSIMHLDADYIRYLFYSIPRRCLSNLQKKCVMIDYWRATVFAKF